MKVSILYILDLGIAGASETNTRNPEGEAVSNGLFSKHCERCDAVGVLVLTKSGKLSLDEGHVKGHLPLRDGASYKIDQEQAVRLLEATPRDSSPTISKDKRVPDRSVGAYIVMHSDGVDAAKVAEYLDNVLPATAKQRLHYVVMLACRVAEEPAGTYDLKLSGVPYMSQLMAELKERGMRPVLAGWDVYVTAAPWRPGKNRDVYEGDSDKKVANLQTIAGRKIVQPKDEKFAQLNKEYRTVFNAYRELHKKVYQIDKDGKLSVKLGTWSQR